MQTSGKSGALGPDAQLPVVLERSSEHELVIRELLQAIRLYSVYTYKPFTYFFFQVHGSMRFLEKQNIRFRRISLSLPFQF